MQEIDRFHLAKQHRRLRPEDYSPEQITAMRRKGAMLRLHAGLSKPYRIVRRLVMKRLVVSDDSRGQAAAAPRRRTLDRTAKPPEAQLWFAEPETTG